MTIKAPSLGTRQRLGDVREPWVERELSGTHKYELVEPWFVLPNQRSAKPIQEEKVHQDAIFRSELLKVLRMSLADLREATPQIEGLTKIQQERIREKIDYQIVFFQIRKLGTKELKHLQQELATISELSFKTLQIKSKELSSLALLSSLGQASTEQREPPSPLALAINELSKESREKINEMIHWSISSGERGEVKPSRSLFQELGQNWIKTQRWLSEQKRVALNHFQIFAKDLKKSFTSNKPRVREESVAKTVYRLTDAFAKAGIIVTSGLAGLTVASSSNIHISSERLTTTPMGGIDWKVPATNFGDSQEVIRSIAETEQWKQTKQTSGWGGVIGFGTLGLMSLGAGKKNKLLNSGVVL